VVTGAFEQPVTLVDGRWQGEPAAPGAASSPSLELWETTFLTGDVDSTPGAEAVVLLGASGGGSGDFVHLAAFGFRDGTLVNLGTAPVGDRTQVQNAWLERGRVVLDVVEAGPGDAACCPTQVARKVYALEGGALRQVSSDVRGVLGIGMLASNEWQLVEIDVEPLPAGTEAPLVHFEKDGVRGFAGCNRFTASVTETTPGRIDIGPGAVATRKACPQPQMDLEQRFLARLDQVERFTFVGGRLALGYRDGERQGTLIFRK
jgi:heat shock protein HslJ